MAKIEHKTFGSVGSVKEPAAQKEQDPQSDLRSLIELGSIIEEKEVNGKVFKMRTLNASERLELAKFLGEEPTAEKLFQFNVKLISMATQEVDGKPLEHYHPGFTGDENDDVLGLRYEIVASMQSPVIGELLSFYNDITERSDAQFDIEQVKN